VTTDEQKTMLAGRVDNREKQNTKAPAYDEGELGRET
jgi:hypothetical protein